MPDLLLVSQREGFGQNMGLVCSRNTKALFCSSHTCFRSVVISMYVFGQIGSPKSFFFFSCSTHSNRLQRFLRFPTQLETTLCPALLWSHPNSFYPVTQYIKLCKALQMCIIYIKKNNRAPSISQKKLKR